MAATPPRTTCGIQERQRPGTPIPVQAEVSASSTDGPGYLELMETFWKPAVANGGEQLRKSHARNV